MKSIKFITLIVCVISLIGFADTLTVRLAKGDVKVVRGGKTSELKIYEKVKEGEKIITGESSFAALISEDGSVYKLAAKTIFDVKSLQSTSSLRSAQYDVPLGKVMAVISKLEKKTEINFYTPTSVAGVRGTVLILDVKPSGTILYVTRGQVAFGRDDKSMNASVGENQMAESKPDNGAIPVREMTPAEQSEAVSGIPVKVTLEVKDKNDSSKATAALKDTLRQTISKDREQQLQNNQQTTIKKEWDIENGRVARVGNDMFQLVQRFKVVDEKNVRSFSIMNNTTANRVTAWDLNAFWAGGVPSIGALIATKDIDSLAPTQIDNRLATKEASKSAGDLIEWSLFRDASARSTTESYRINGGTTYNGAKGMIALTTENGVNYLILKNANGGVDYKFARENKNINLVTGSDATLGASSFDGSSFLSLLQGANDFGIYVSWIPKKGAFNSEKVEIIVSADHLASLLLYYLTPK